MPRTTKKAKATELFRRADKYYDQGRLKQAFRLMLAAAKLGDAGAQVNVANYFDHGQGVRRNRAKAFYWYRRAYRRGDTTAAHNIAIVYRREAAATGARLVLQSSKSRRPRSSPRDRQA